jgi:hypothetical protein
LADASPIQIGAWQGVELAYRDGRKDTLAVFKGGIVDVGSTQFVRDQVKARISDREAP